MSRDDSDRTTPKQADPESMVARLGKSAAGLSKSIFQATPSANDLISAGTSGKAGASSSTFASPSSGSRLDALAESSGAARSSSSAGVGSFRSGHVAAHTAAQEAAFSDFLDGTEIQGLGNTTLETKWQEAAPSSEKPADHDPLPAQASSSVAEQQRRDGLAVVELLSQADEEIPFHEQEQMGMSDEELRIMRRALFEDESSLQVSAVDWNNILNFVPDFLRGPDGARGDAGPAETSYMNLGVTDTTEAGQRWLEEWNRVLTGYNDEVWGDLGDLVKEARNDVQQAKKRQDKQQPDFTAIRRLQTVLTRVRARL